MTSAKARQTAHELIDRLAPAQVDAVVRLLHVMADEDDEELSPEDIAAIEQGSRPGQQLYTMEEVLADFGLTMAEFEAMGRQPDGETRALDR
jgi:hypothetical protein